MERREGEMMKAGVARTRAEITFLGKKIGLAGLFHPLADAVKMIFKEAFAPPNADKVLHALAPILAMFPPLVVMAEMPFAEPLCLGAPREDPRSGPGPIHRPLFCAWTGAGAALTTPRARPHGTSSHLGPARHFS